MLMEMMRQLNYLHEKVWQKKSDTSNLPIQVGEYQCRSWLDVETMIDELARFCFRCRVRVNIHDFYVERKRAHEHKLLVDEEPFCNVVNESKLKRIHLKMHQDAQKVQQTCKANINKKIPHTKKGNLQESTSKITLFPQSTQEPVG